MRGALLWLLRTRRRTRRTARSRPIVGVVVSVAIHAALILAILFIHPARRDFNFRRGQPLFVELPNAAEPPPKGNPSASGGPPGPATPPPAAPSRPTPRAAPQPPAPRAAPAPAAPRAIAKALPEAAPRPAPTRPAPPAPRSSDSAERAVAKSTPPPPAKAPEPAPAAPAPEPAPRVAAAQPPRETHTPEPATPDPSKADKSAGTQVAMAPTNRGAGSAPGAPDIRQLLRGGGGGGGPRGTAHGREGGWGGIEGEPVPLDSPDPKFQDYLNLIRRAIQAKWSYPCMKDPDTHRCEYKSAQLQIKFGIAKDGHMQVIELVRTSGMDIYDEYALNAVRLASPFPPVPDSLSKKGLPILATFNYILDTSLTNVLR